MITASRRVSLACSAVVWGSGQALQHRYLRALLFFSAQVIVLAVELSSGYYVEYLAGQIEGRFLPLTHGGFFLRGLYGLITLGETPRRVTVDGLTPGDHSIILMIQGIYAVIVLAFVLLIWWNNVRDAWQHGGTVEHGRLHWLQDAKNFVGAHYPYVVMSPALVGVCIFLLIPILFSFLVAFTNYNVYHIPPTKLVEWVGVQNFLDIFRVPIWSSTFLGVLTWNIVFALLTTLSVFALGLMQALIINHKLVAFPKFWRSLFIMPWAMPGLISLLIFRVLFNGQFGPLNDYLLQLGLISERIPWLTDPWNAKIVILVVNLWLGFPYWMVMISGVLTSIDRNIYEAARIDGVNSWQNFRYLTLPLVLQAVGALLILSIAGNFNNFGLIYFLTDGGPANPAYQVAGDTDILISWIYKLTLDQRMYNMASVMSVLIFLVIAPIAAFNLLKTRALREDG